MGIQLLTLMKSLRMYELIPFTQCRFSEVRKVWSKQKRCCLAILKPLPLKQQFPAWCCCLGMGCPPHSGHAGCVPIHANHLPKNLCLLVSEECPDDNGLDLRNFTVYFCLSLTLPAPQHFLTPSVSQGVSNLLLQSGGWR